MLKFANRNSVGFILPIFFLVGCEQLSPVVSNDTEKPTLNMAPIAIAPGQYSRTMKAVKFDYPGVSNEQSNDMMNFRPEVQRTSKTFCIKKDEKYPASSIIYTIMDSMPKSGEQYSGPICTMVNANVKGDNVSAHVSCRGGSELAGGSEVAVEGAFEKQKSALKLTYTGTNPTIAPDVYVLIVEANIQRIGECS